MSTKPIYITPEGLKQLEQEFETLKTIKRLEITEKIKEARDFGDLSENSEYDAAMNEQAVTEARIREIEEQLKVIVVLDNTSLRNDVISVGSIVTVLDYEDNTEMKITLVGKTESDPSQNKISDQSPLGKALLGQTKDTEIVVIAPGGEFKYKVLKIAIPK